MKLFKFAVAFFVAVLVSSQLHADITFNFTYADVDNNTGFGFDDAVEGATRRATVDAVTVYLNSVLDHDGRVDINWNQSINDPTAGTLASMGPFFFANQGFSNGFVFDHATTGNDPLPGTPDGQGEVNFGRNWNSDLSGPAGNEFDLFTVVLHEITHSMGFLSLFDETSGDTVITGTRAVFDQFIEDGAGNRLLSGSNFVGDVSDFTSDDLFFNTGSERFKLFAPSSFQGGSSISHFDPSVAGQNIMFPSIAPGVSRREYSEADLAVLETIGWNLRAIPEPTSALILIGGMGLVCLRRRR